MLSSPQKIYNLAFDADSPTLSDEEDDYEDEGDEDDAECEFDYTEPLQGQEHPILTIYHCL